MIEDDLAAPRSLLNQTTDIVANFVSGNPTPQTEIPALIEGVYRSLSDLTLGSSQLEAEAQPKATPAQIRKSITPGGLVSFEDGRTYKMLKRHLTTRGLTVAEYRAKWGLPLDYPSTAPEYAARRSEFAKAIGLGRKFGRKAAAKPPVSPKKKAAKPKP